MSKELKKAADVDVTMYKTTYTCRNCGKIVNLEVPKRTRVSDFIQRMRCPNCECKLI